MSKCKQYYYIVRDGKQIALTEVEVVKIHELYVLENMCYAVYDTLPTIIADPNELESIVGSSDGLNFLAVEVLHNQDNYGMEFNEALVKAVEAWRTRQKYPI